MCSVGTRFARVSQRTARALPASSTLMRVAQTLARLPPDSVRVGLEGVQVVRGEAGGILGRAGAVDVFGELAVGKTNQVGETRLAGSEGDQAAGVDVCGLTDGLAAGGDVRLLAAAERWPAACRWS